jgi:anhydro-N-acetylmuramic acid kinase
MRGIGAPPSTQRRVVANRARRRCAARGILSDPYFARVPPKSTVVISSTANGSMRSSPGAMSLPADVQATLVALTARTIADAVRTHCAATTEVLVCGGGANNAALMDALSRALAPRTVRTTAALGVAVEHVEALAFAWLAREALGGRPGNLPDVTGARGLRVLGAIYPR